MADLFTPFAQFFDKNGDPLSKGTLKFLEEGTTDTLLDTFSDSALLNKNTNPVVLDGEGRLPNLIFGKGVYNVILRSKATTASPNGVLIDQLDPIGGSSGLKTAFDLWDESTIYNIPNIVSSLDDKFYKSLTDGNFNNDPTLLPGENPDWEEWPVNGIYNTKIPYGIGDIAQTVDGNLWKSLTAPNLNNDPDTDDGTNWANAIDEQWVNKSAAFTVFAGKSYQIDASGGSVDAALQTSYVVGDVITVHNESISTNLVRLTNTALTIKDNNGTITSADNLVLSAGNSVQLVAKTTTILEVVGAKV